MPSVSFAKAYWLSVGVTFVAAAALGLIGSFPVTHALGNKAGATVIVGCFVSWLTGCLGAIPLASVFSKSGAKQAEAILASTAVRFLGALMMIVPLTLSGWFDRVTFVSAFIASYMALLLVDTILVVHLLRRSTGMVK